MLAISPHDKSSNLRWLLEDNEKETANYLIMSCASREKLITEKNSDNSINRYFDDFDLLQARINTDHEKSGFHDDSRVDKMLKKLEHNARERDRRNRINKLYSDLRSVLPADDESKKLSIPATISRVLKYIPELQKEVKRLSQKKENLIMSKISKEAEEADLSMDFKKNVIKRRRTDQISSSTAAIAITQMRDEEIIIQISVPRIENGCCSGALTYLEMEAFLVLSASSFKSFDGRVFCNLHIQAHESQIKDAEILKEKIWSFFEEREELK